MVQSARACLDDLQRIASDQSSEGRREALRRLTDLFIATSEMQSPSDSAEFGATIGKLALSADEDARIELSNRVAKRPNTPRNLAVTLGNDDTIAVAAPVLEHAVNLTAEDLVDIARRHGQSHMLAICKRLNIDPRVTDVLVERGNDPVLEAIAENDSAQFSDSGFTTITRRGAHNLNVNEALLKRDDFPEHLKPEVGRNAVTQFEAEMANSQAGPAINAMMESTLGNRAPPPNAVRITFRKEIDLLHEGGNLQEDTVIRFAKARCQGSTAYAIAKLADLDLPTVFTCVFTGSPVALAILSKALGFSSAAFWELVELRKAAKALPVNYMGEATSALEAVDSATAQRILRFLKVRRLAALAS
ncbi:MAG: DUF2336 domain-containing protein [Methyloligellaceae bacterium]